ncbi:MAG: chemotaxis protein CheW [Phycisphaerales bacterium]
MSEASQDATRRLLERPLGPEELAAQTREVARVLEEDACERTSILVVECGGERIGLPGSLVRRVSGPSPVHRVPHRTNAVLKGIVNLGGQLSLVGDLVALLELPKAATATGPGPGRDRRMLLIGETPEQWVVEVDRVLGVLRIESTRLESPPVTIRAARDHHSEHLVDLREGEAAGGPGRIAVLGSDKLLAGLRRSLP